MKGPATGEKGTSHGPLCMNAPTSRPVSPAPPASTISLPPDPFSLPRLACSHPLGMFVFVCVPLSLYFTSVVAHLTPHRLQTYISLHDIAQKVRKTDSNINTHKLKG